MEPRTRGTWSRGTRTGGTWSRGTRLLCTLTLLLVSVCPLCCRGNWMWLGVTSAGVPEKLVCSSLPLSPRQLDLCLRKPLIWSSVADGARIAVSECRSQFRHERWNCSTTEDPPGFGPELTSGTKETAFIYAVMAAGLVHAVTRSCSQGNMSECGCDARLKGGAPVAGGGAPGAGGGTPGMGGWHWGGCSDHIQYGIWFSRTFMGNTLRNESSSRGGFTLSTMNGHNSEAGRQAIARTMSIDCRCHGVSGSCAVKTCWRTMAPFGRVGSYLKERYERSVQVSHRSRRKLRRKDRLHVDKHQLIYFNKSPNYCVEDRRRGVAGTRGRRCNRTSTGPDGCNLLCCGRGYNTHVVRNVQRCECKFVWCCYVRCRRCESMSDMHTCK
ncbi:protein Wnt-16 [Mugil cephalus]|uniref:protein Wnt-16 n=1 Tax=Mugil cephalus TaxID=48193 RepID=UPI001FB69F10|nr:protein Wnt-16 [Mugil cephalus]